MSATVIIPTTGSPELKCAIDSVLNQTYLTTCYVVADGPKFHQATDEIVKQYSSENIKLCHLPINVGANGFYGHRVYAAFTHLVDTDYIMYLDQDNWYDENHVKTCIDNIRKNDLDWCYSLRKIYSKSGDYLCNDDCESLGKWKTYHGVNHIDTNTYCLKTEVAIRLASVWHGGWGQDRVFLSTISQHFTKWDCTGLYTANYRVDGGPGSVNKEFFDNGNEVMRKKYNGEYPWRKTS